MDVTSEVVTARADLLESWPSLHSDDSNVRFMLWASFAEIYNEQIFDLLESSTVAAPRSTRPSSLHLRDGDGRPYISGLREVEVATAEEAWQLVQIGRENQHIAATRLNRASSRSHSIFMLRLIQVVDVDQPKFARVASLSFCDLAGSERSTAAGGCNERVKEAGNINLSLMTLGRCMEALRRNQTRRDQSAAAPRASIIVPFRNSKLTRMFQSFLCGEGRVVMITNVSPCANVFDETLHAVNYSALASQVLVGSSVPGQSHPLSILTVPAPADKHKVCILRKQETAAATTKIAEKKRDTIMQEEVIDDGKEDDDEDTCSSDEDTHEICNDERQKLMSVIKKLQQSKAELEMQIRKEVCEEMQKQLVRIESEYQDSLQQQQEILEEKFDRKWEIYTEAVQKSCKRQRRDDADDYIPSVELHAAEVKISQCAKELAAAQESVNMLSSERDALAAKLTKAEFSTSRAHEVRAQLENTVEELRNKLSEAEHRHEVTCRQLRRDKAQLEQRLNAAEKSAANQDRQQEASTVHGDLDKTGKITELEAALQKEQDTVHDLEQRLKVAEADAKVVEKTWAEHCKGIEAACQEKALELAELREKYDVLERNVQETVKTCEEAQRNHAQMKQVLETAQNELSSKETQLKESVSAAESLKEEIKRLTAELENVRKDRVAERDVMEEQCVKLKTEIEELKQQFSTAVDGKVSDVQQEVSEMREKLKQTKDEKSAAVDSLNIEIAKRTALLMESKDELAARVSEIGQLEKQLVAERASRCQLEDTLADCEKKLMESRSEVSEEREKYSTLGSSFEALQKEFNETKDALKSAEEEIAGYLSTIRSNEPEEKNAREVLTVMKKQLQQCDDREKSLQQQLHSSSELIKELQEKDTSKIAELADRDKKLQTCHATLSDLRKMLEEERQKSEMASKNARSHEEVVEQMKLTITEQERTMQTQDQTLLERDNEMQGLNARLAQLNADRVELESVNNQIRQKDTRIRELETIVLTQDQTLCKCDNEVQSLQAKNADLRSQTESFNTEIRQKNSRIRELEKEVEKAEKSRECLKRDVHDTTSELKMSEYNLAEVKKEFAKTKQELENLQADENDSKSLVKQLYQRELELSNLRKQLQLEQDKHRKLERETEKLKADNKDLRARYENRDELVADLEKLIKEKDRLMIEREKEIQHLKAAESAKPGHSKREKHPSSEAELEMLQKKMEQLSRAASVKDQTIIDMKEQNLQLQQQICLLQHQENVSEAEEETHQRRGTRKSRIPTSQRMPLRATDGNADVSVGVLAEGGVVVDLDETLGPSKHTRESRRVRITQKKSSEVADEPCPRATRMSRKRTTSILDTVDSAIAEVPEEPPPPRRLRSRHHY